MTNYFLTNINELKSNLKSLEKLISLKRTSNSMPSAVIENNITLAKPEDIEDVINS